MRAALFQYNVQGSVLVVSLALGACQAHTAVPLTRYVGGEVRAGTYVPPQAYEAYLRAELAFSRGDYRAAAQGFNQALAAGPDDAYVLARIAECMQYLNQPDRAERLVDDALESYPDSEALWLVKARLAEKDGQLVKAIDAYTRAEEAAPFAEEAPIGLARLLRNHGAVSRADVVLQRYLERTGAQSAEAARARLLAAIETQDITTATDAAETLLDVAPGRAQEVRDLAKKAYAEDAPLLTAQLLGKVSRSVPDEVLRVQALIAANQFTQARAVLLTSSPDRFGGLVPTARLFLAVGLPRRATELADVALSARSSDSEARFIRGLARLRRGQPTAAAADFAAVPPGASDFASARLHLADVFMDLGAESLALEVLAHSLRHAPQSLALRSVLARLRLRYMGLGPALDLFEDVPDVLHMVERAELLDLGGDPRAAQQTYSAIELDQALQLPEHARVRVRAEHLWNNKRTRQAVVLLTEHTARMPDDLTARLRLIDMLKQLGQTQEAKRLQEQTQPWLYTQMLRKRLEDSP